MTPDPLDAGTAAADPAPGPELEQLPRDERASRKRDIVTAQQWGRVDSDGTVWVRTSAGERAVGQYPGASEEEALAYFTRKFEELRSQADLLEQRLRAGQIAPNEALATIKRLSEAAAEANAVGDLEGLVARLAALEPVVQEKRAEQERARQEARRQAVATRTELVEEAEAIAATDVERIPWKSSGDRLRELFDTWKAQQREVRLDRHTEDELWKRFSHARTTFDRKRRQYFGALDEQRSAAKAAKEALVAEAEALASSTEWGATAAAYRALMDRWKAAGRAAKRDDDALWARFRAAQDTFFSARAATAQETDNQYRANLEAKEALLTEAEALLPVEDPQAARAALRDIQERWEAAGRVPRSELGRVEARLRAVEQAVRQAEDDRWRRSNPEARARAEGVVAQLEAAITALRTDLEKAKAAGNTRKIQDTEQALQAREEWLEQARRALSDFSG
ncbi:MAG: DUF349 domain-containing protein [Actinomycetales bacterium]|nr:DUF349 domain-containing protein [Actinomycetales bacterium]